MRITDALVVEHTVFRRVFEFIEATLAGSVTIGEVKLLGRLLEALLANHAEAEDNLVFVALNHMLAERGQFDRLHQEHRELDLRLERVRSVPDLAGARRLLAAVVAASRKHFVHEEQLIFPVIDQVVPSEMLALLNAARMQPRETSTMSPPPGVASAFAAV